MILLNAIQKIQKYLPEHNKYLRYTKKGSDTFLDLNFSANQKYFKHKTMLKFNLKFIETITQLSSIATPQKKKYLLQIGKQKINK